MRSNTIDTRQMGRPYGETAKVLDAAEVIRLRALLRERPDLSGMPQAGGHYPRMLYARAYYDAQQTFKLNPDPKLRQAAHDLMKRSCILVEDEEDEKDALEDGYLPRADGFRIAEGMPDPRIPTGREARRSARARKQSMQEEMLELRRRMAQLEAEAAAMSLAQAETTSAEGDEAGTDDESAQARPRRRRQPAA